MAIISLSAPWVTYYRELDSLFKHDNKIHVLFDEEDCSVTLYVDDIHKANALSVLLPKEKKYGSVTLQVNVVPYNCDLDHECDDMSYVEMFEAVFDGNPAFDKVKEVHGVLFDRITYVVFAKEVVQYFNDDLGDLNGVHSTLYENIARNVFDKYDGVFFCTSTDGPSLPW